MRDRKSNVVVTPGKFQVGVEAVSLGEFPTKGQANFQKSFEVFNNYPHLFTIPILPRRRRQRTKKLPRRPRRGLTNSPNGPPARSRQDHRRRQGDLQNRRRRRNRVRYFLKRPTDYQQGL